jgi:ribosomal protein L29
MKKGEINELRAKTIRELEKEAEEIRKEIAKLKLDAEVNPLKDTNFLVKKRKRLAVILTLISEKKMLEKSATKK